MRHRENIKPIQKPQVNQVTNESVDTTDIQNKNLFIVTKDQLVKIARRTINEALEEDKYIGQRSDKITEGTITLSVNDGNIYVKCNENLVFGENIEYGTLIGSDGKQLRGTGLRGYLFESFGLFDETAAYELASKIKALGGFIHPSMLSGGSIGTDRLKLD